MTDNRERLFYLRIHALYDYAPRILPINILLMTIVFFVLDGKVAPRYLLIPLVVITALAIGRFIHVAWCLKQDPTWFIAHCHSLKIQFLIGTVLSSLAWGFTYLALVPHLLPQYDYLLLLMIGGLVSGTVVSMSTSAIAFFSFIGPLAMLLLTGLLLDFQKENILVTVIVILFFSAIAFTYLRSHTIMLESLQLHFEKEDLIEALSNSNAQLVDANKRITEISNTDELTAISNRRCFFDHLQREWNRARRNHLGLSLLMIDIDHFKLYNDHYGHLAGDHCLKALAAVFKEHIHRANDLLARYGGEEFVILLPETELAGAIHIAKAIEKAVAAISLPHATSPVAPYVTISIGVAYLEPEDEKFTSLIAAADRQLYVAKEMGRNRVVS